MHRLMLALGATAAAGLALAGGEAMAAYDVNMTRGVTPISADVYRLHMLIVWICAGIGAGVFAVIFWSILHHRKSRGAQASQFHHNTTVEIVWTVIPFFILVGMAWPATKTLIAMEDTSQADLTIKVTGYQWKWKYDYIEDDISFFSNLAPSSRGAIYEDPSQVENYLLEVDKEVVLPVNKKIRFLLTADDVIHAWWVPALGMKKDAIPGFINEMWARIEKPGVYRGQCAELCGKDHGFMPIVVVAKTEAAYRQWVKDQRGAVAVAAAAAEREWTKDELMARGKTVYTTSCAACHQAGGQGLPGTFPPITGSPVATGPLAAHLERVMKGKPGTAMQPFAAQLNDVDIAAVVTYQRNALGNEVGDLLQPSAVKAARR